MNNKIYNLLNKKGFTLIEVMVALAIVSGLLIVLITSMNYHLEIQTNHKTKLILTNLAKDKLDSLKNTKKEEKGKFQEPFKWAEYQTEIKDSAYQGIQELTVRVRGLGEEVILSELEVSQIKQQY